MRILYYYKKRYLKKIAKIYYNKILINIKNDYFRFYNININKYFNREIVDNIDFITN